MALKVIHAPDGATIPGSLCEEPTGDVSTFESDVDCPECLDRLEESERTFDQLARPLKDLRAYPAPAGLIGAR
jgi:hypothetical protein